MSPSNRNPLVVQRRVRFFIEARRQLISRGKSEGLGGGTSGTCCSGTRLQRRYDESSNDVKSMWIKIGWTRCRPRRHEDRAKKEANRPVRGDTAIKRTEIPESAFSDEIIEVPRVVKRHVLTSQIVQESMHVYKLNSLLERIASLWRRSERCQRFKRHRRQ